MPLAVGRWVRRDSADRTDFGLAALNFCRALRSHDKVVDARYWWVTASEIAVVGETEDGTTPGELNTVPNIADGIYALEDVAINTTNDVWGGAGAGNASYQAASR